MSISKTTTRLGQESRKTNHEIARVYAQLDKDGVPEKIVKLLNELCKEPLYRANQWYSYDTEKKLFTIGERPTDECVSPVLAAGISVSDTTTAISDWRSENYLHPITESSISLLQDDFFAKLITAVADKRLSQTTRETGAQSNDLEKARESIITELQRDLGIEVSQEELVAANQARNEAAARAKENKPETANVVTRGTGTFTERFKEGDYRSADGFGGRY